MLANYECGAYRSTTEQRPPRLERLALVDQDSSKLEMMRPAVELAEQAAEATCLARDLSVGPSNVVTPDYLADQAQQVADREGIQVQHFEKADLEQMGMGGILAVNQGSARPPRMVVLRHRPPGAAKTLAVVGKAITFDSGGISIKHADGMGAMKHDMSGAAAVIGFCQLAARMKLEVNVVGLFAATENLPSGSAYKPGDVYRAYNGKTMEIVNTDAEGRVTLSDVLAYAAEQRPDAIVDLATLTGACVVALGHYATGAMGTDTDLIDLFRRAGEHTGERVWPLPLWSEYDREIESPIADIKNSGGRWGGAITAAAFLKNFVDDIPWVHLDIAGTAWVESQAYVPPYQAKGMATGVGVRLLYEFSRLWMAS
ncbi:MAG: leucyl aminopeptidase [Chloroflexi bacterium]|nr:leucyl aminopeptidase [Chloroflexota bacterium]